VVYGGAKFEFLMVGPNGVTVTVTYVDDNNGTYTATYNAIVPGQYNLTITSEGLPILDPFHRPFVHPGM